ncbi:MAG: hypothetical protein K0R18_374 [Bacillales bacterium]|jgi:hypothetical protein|nr:hypothetical protein [Bacillales bacterium]
MTNNEKLEIIREISGRPEASDKAGYTIIAGGALAVTAIIAPAIIVTALGIIGPAMLAFGVGGTGILLAKNLLKKDKQKKKVGA